LFAARLFDRSFFNRSLKVLCALGVAAALTLVFSAAGLFRAGDRALYDGALRYRVNTAPRPLNPAILKVDLNDSSEAELADRIDTREAFAAALNVLGESGADAALDFIFRRALPEDWGMILAGKRFTTLVYAVIPVPERSGSFSFQMEEKNRAALRAGLWRIRGNLDKLPGASSFIMSQPEISASATMLGHIGVTVDQDGVYRRTPLLYRWEDGVVPSLALAMAVSELGIDPLTIELRPGTGLVLPLEGEKPLVIPCNDEGILLVPFSSRWETDRYRYSFSEIAGAFDEPDFHSDLLSELSGALVLMADTTTAKRDYGITPFETSYPLSGIHAAVLSGILDEFFYTESSRAFKAAAAAVLFVLAFAWGLVKRDRTYHVGFAALAALFCIFSFVLWNKANRSPWVSGPAFFAAAAWALGFGVRLFDRYKEQLLLKTALSRYFPRSLAERIVAEGKTDLVPARKELTMLFADIAGFTRWSSGLEPGEVHLFLTDYLETMAGIIFDHGGTVDKYMGDGLLAFFGDPVEQGDHARRGVAAAAAMQKTIPLIAEKWRDRTGIDLAVRIGINSGTVIVGNLGTRTRIDYTVIGSAVNLAQRMESSAPRGGVLVAESAWEKTKDDFAYREKRSVTVKGYDQPVNAWELLL
jgi:adenylate cyclase